MTNVLYATARQCLQREHQYHDRKRCIMCLYNCGMSTHHMEVLETLKCVVPTDASLALAH